MRGILIIASGHENYYKMALNCAISIKATSNIPVALAYRGNLNSFLTKKEQSFFNTKIYIKDQYILKNGIEDFTFVKLNVYYLSPYEETIYIDADSLCLFRKPLSDLFTESSLYPLQLDIQDEKMVFTNNEEWKYAWYSSENQGLLKLRSTYNISLNTPIYQVQSSIIYFRKEPQVAAFFDTSLTCYAEDKLRIVRNWNGWLLDELMFIISQGIHNIKMQVPFQKVYYPYYDGYLATDSQMESILSNYYFYSTPGIHCHEVFAKLYNELIQEYYKYEKLDLSRIFLHQHKLEFMPERISL